MVKELLTPGKIGETTLKNRVIFPSMCNYYCDDKGFVTEQLKEYVRARARGGAAMIIMPGSPMERRARPGPRCPPPYTWTAGKAWQVSAIRTDAGFLYRYILLMPRQNGIPHCCCRITWKRTIFSN